MAIDDDLGEANRRTCVVLSGRSFIGRSLVSALLKSEKWIVRIADPAPSLDLDRNEEASLLLCEAVSSGRASYFQVDVRDKSQIIRAIEGSSVVFHMDATDSSLSDFYTQHSIIVQGTKNVINACRECKIKRLIYNSSADVVFDGIHDIHNGDESLPYPWKFEDMLNDLKAQAEALVLFTNSCDGLLTCALRPSNAFGPGDVHLVPFILNFAKSSFSKFIIGNGENLSDFTYVDNIAYAHICAEEALCSRNASVAGKAFFITNSQPMKFWDFASLILEGLGYQSPTITVPVRVVPLILAFINWVHKKFGPQRNSDSILAPSVVHLVSKTTTFNCSKAKNDIGYSPVVSLEEGVTNTIESFSHYGKGSLCSRFRDLTEPSKVEKLLGSGRVADILLWRDERKTFICFLSTVALFHWFFLSGRTFISSIAKLLLLVTIVLFSNGILPSSFRLGFTDENFSSSRLEISEGAMKNAFMFLASTWNQWMQTMRLLTQPGDWSVFVKVLVSLYIFKLLCTFSISAVIGIGLIFAYAAFFLYEQYETEIDGISMAFLFGMKKVKILLMRKLPVSITSFFDNYLVYGIHEDTEYTMGKNPNSPATK